MAQKQPKKKTTKSSVKKALKNSDASEKKKDKRLANLRPFKKGQSGNPGGRPKGARDRRTVIWEALKMIAEKKGATPEEIEAAIQVSGIDKAIKGSYHHYAEISNGLYGKITDNVDIKSGGKSLADLIAHANVSRGGKRTQVTGEDQE